MTTEAPGVDPSSLVPSLAGRKVVVVGGASGFGLASARAAASVGADVVVVTRSDGGVARALGQLPSRARGLVASSTDPTAMEAAFADIGPVHHLVYTAADAAVTGPITRLPIDDVRRAFETRYFGALNAVRAAVPHLSDEGSVTLTSGAATTRPRATSGALASVCGAMESLMRALAVELAPRRVNLVRPGFTRTEMWDDLDPDQREALFAGAVHTSLVGHVGDADEVGRAYLYCMTQTYATGSIVTVDGGYSLAW